MLRKIIKNLSGEKKQILNRDVADGDSYDVPINQWLKLYDSVDIRQHINTGVYIMNDGTQDLSPINAIKMIELFQEESSFITKTNNRYILTLGNNGSANDAWLCFMHNLPTNDSPWTPNVDVHVLSVSVTNKTAGQIDDPMITEIRVYENTFGSSSIDTSDDVAWFVQSDGENLVRNNGNGKKWIYDNSSEGDYMFADRQYAFRFTKLDGHGTPNKVVVTLLVEEI